MKGRNPIFIHYVHDMDRARRFYESVFEVDRIEDMQARIERVGGRMTELREPAPRVPARVATFQDTEGNGFELRQSVPPPAG